jgi:hypothetical protein
MSESSFQKGFGGGCGLILGVLLALILIPLLCVGGCALLGGGCLMVAGEAAKQAKENAERYEKEHPTQEQKTKEPAQDEPKERREKDKLTLENFYRIKDGMTYAEVKEIIGPASEEIASSNIGQGTQFEVKTVMLTWNRFLASANITFQNGRVVAKAQMGLPHEDTKDTKAESPDKTHPKVEQKANPELQPKDKVSNSSTPKPQTRTWTDATGGFSIEAEFVSANGPYVKLKKSNGDIIKIPLEKLSQENQAWLKDRGK